MRLWRKCAAVGKMARKEIWEGDTLDRPEPGMIWSSLEGCGLKEAKTTHLYMAPPCHAKTVNLELEGKLSTAIREKSEIT